MQILLNYPRGNPRLQEAFEALGHRVSANCYAAEEIASRGIVFVLFDFKQMFKTRWSHLRLLRQLRRAGIVTATWNRDAPWHVGVRGWEVAGLLRAGLLDLYATHSLQATERARTTVLYLPNAAWMSHYHLGDATLEVLREDHAYEVDVSFLGNLDAARFREHTGRVRFLERLGKRLREEKVHYRFHHADGIPPERQRRIIQRSRINLSCGAASDARGIQSWGLPERCFGIPACGGFLLADERRHVRDDFKVAEEIATYRDLDDCMQKIRQYLACADERRQIAENGYHRVISEHTYQHRAQSLLGAVQGILEGRHA